MPKRVFVFSSNTSGIHGKGAARYAYESKGAQWGKSYGHVADSFAIPTRDRDMEPLPLDVIRYFVMGFLAYAYTHPKLTFRVTRIASGTYTDAQIAPLFEGAPENCMFEEPWRPYLGDTYNYWEYRV